MPKAIGVDAERRVCGKNELPAGPGQRVASAKMKNCALFTYRLIPNNLKGFGTNGGVESGATSGLWETIPSLGRRSLRADWCVERLGTARFVGFDHLSQHREIRVLRVSCSSFVLGLDPFVDFTPVYRHFWRCIDTQAYLFALHIEHSDSDMVPDDDALA